MGLLNLVVLVSLFICLIEATIVLPGGSDKSVRMFVAYCPTDFTGAGAVVDVNPMTGNWSIRTHVKFPSEVFGCIADYDPTYAFSPSDPDTLWFDFTSDAGYMVAVDTRLGNITTINSADWFFTGFINFKYLPSSNTLRGLTGTVTENGFCSDGCIGFGYQDVANRKYKQLKVLPFKAAGDDTSFVDWKNETMYFQASYDLSDTPCAPVDSDDCLVAVNFTTGALISKTYTPRWYAYKYGHGLLGRNSAFAFMTGFNTHCNQSTNGTTYVFGTVDFATATATPQSCVPSSVVIDMDEWISSFSAANTMMVTASGNGYGDDPQFINFNTTTGSVIKQSHLTGLAKALKADMKLIFVWAVDFLDVTPE